MANEKSNYKCEFRDNGAPVIREYYGARNMVRESEVVGYQGIAQLKGHSTGEILIAFGDYYNGHGLIQSGVVYRMFEA